MIRLFAAVAVPEHIGQQLTRLQKGLPGARWRPVEAFHVTLRFFGEIDERRADDLDAELSRVTSPAFEVALNGAGDFGDGGVSNAVWVGVEENERLKVLAGRCEAAARRAGLEPSNRTYRPHVTLAYLTRPEPSRVGAWVRNHNLTRMEAFRVDRFGLYSSRLGHGGSTYTLEREYPLG
ncbi:RNA 2',3'-cyclic phosphodiesterase [Brevundimonas sp.]|uniref:RNA 2',3'-cyclic phosphodiesterase n=1 Tax=Brevundimonas sp. TaxID=1871086 RepID=UPI0025DFDE59|nr:RNA 2',3'-cyclic phosphodiesterase [Brevundimonas sp.]